MNIDLKNMPKKELQNFKGGENSIFAGMFADANVRIMSGTVPPGASIGLHTHEDSCEVVFCLSGTALAIYDGVEERVLPGMAHYCPKGHSHTMKNDGDEDFKILAVIPQQA